MSTILKRPTFPMLAEVWFAGAAVSLETGIFLMQVFAVGGLLLAGYALARRRLTRSHLPGPAWMLAAVLLWLVVAALLSPAPGDGTSFLATKFFMPLAALWAGFHLSRVENAVLWVAPALLVAGVFGALNGFVQYLFGVDLIYGQTIEHMPGDIVPFYLPVGLLNMALTFAGMQMLLFLFLLPWAWRQRGSRSVWIWIGLALIALSVAIAFRRGPWLGTAAAGGLFLLSRGRKVAIPTLLAGVLVMVGLFTFSAGFRARVLDTANLSTASEQDRVLLWQAAGEMGLDHPLTGIGPGRWRTEVADYVDMQREWDSLAHPHSDPMWLLAVGGIPALLLGLAVTVLVLRREAATLITRSGREEGAWMRSGLALAWVGFAVAGLFQCYLLDGEVMIALGLLLGATWGQSSGESSR